MSLLARSGPVTAALLLLLTGAPAANAQTIEDQQWHLNALKIYEAQRISRGEGVVVGVVDSGVDKTRPDLADAVLPGTGFDTAKGSDGTVDNDGHGTAMATLIAGRGIDGGALGIAPKAKILPVAGSSEGKKFTTGAVAQGIIWAADHGAKVINLSLVADSNMTPNMLQAVNYAMDRDVVLVAGTGNEGEHRVGAPANIRGVIAVAGTTEQGGPWKYSNAGPPTVLAAPAEHIVTAVPAAVSRTGYVRIDGTSASTALVSGVAALVRARFPEMSAANVVNRLMITATDLLQPGRDDATGFGMVNPVGALTANVAAVTRNPLSPPERTSTANTSATPGATPPPTPIAAQPPGTSAPRRGLVAGLGLLATLLASGLVITCFARRTSGA